MLSLLVLTPAKVTEGVVKLSSQDTEQYIAKFSFSPRAHATINGSFHTDDRAYFDNHPHKLTLCLYDDKTWPKFRTAMEKGSLCIERRQLASWSAEIKPVYLHVPGHPPRHDFSFDAHLTAPSRYAHYWFAMIMDCYLEEYDAHPPPMKFDLTFLNGGSQLPADESGMTAINAFALVLLAAYGAVYFMQLYVQWTRLKQGHLITLVFAAAYVLQAIATLCELCHLRRFAADGKGLRWRHTWLAADFFSGVAQSISELTISFMLIALAFGWTLGLQSQEPLDGIAGRLIGGLQQPGKLLKGLRSPSALLLGGIAAAQLVLQWAGRRYEEDFNNFHDHEHWPGLTLIGLRLLLCTLFVWALRRSLRVEKQSEVLDFLRKLQAPPPTPTPTPQRRNAACGSRPHLAPEPLPDPDGARARASAQLLGSLWFVCLPLLVLLAFALPPYRRHQVVAGGSIVLQAVALALLSTLFLQRSEYYRISSLAHLGSVFDAGFSAGRSNKIAVD